MKTYEGNYSCKANPWKGKILGSYSPLEGIWTADYFSDRTLVGSEWKSYVLVHEKEHEKGGDEADAAMAEFGHDPEKALLVNALRYVDNKRGLNTEDARISEDFFKKYSGEAEVLEAIRELGDHLDESGLYEFAVTGDDSHIKQKGGQKGERIW